LTTDLFVSTGLGSKIQRILESDDSNAISDCEILVPFLFCVLNSVFGFPLRQTSPLFLNAQRQIVEITLWRDGHILSHDMSKYHLRDTPRDVL
jgi:hypothetical protein